LTRPTLKSQLAEANVVAALDLGANDYIGKPFRTGELLARIRPVLRRDIKAKGERSFYQNGTLEVDILEHVIARCGEPIRLAPTERHDHRCSDRGMLNTVKQAMRQASKMWTLIGGFRRTPPLTDEYVQKAVLELKALNPNFIIPAIAPAAL
jgi:CheY-like chemotaxis protein